MDRHALANDSGLPGAFEECFARVKERLRGVEGVAVLPALEVCARLAANDDERWRVVLARALVEQQSAQTIAAYGHYEDFLVASAETRDATWIARRTEVAKVVETLEAEILKTQARLTVSGSPDTSVMHVTDATGASIHVGNTPWRAFLVPGSYRVVIHAEGHVPFETTVELARGMRQAVVTTLVVAPVERSAPDRTVAWVLGGIGAGAVVTGAVFTGLALDDAARLDELRGEILDESVVAEDRRLRRRLDARETVSWVCYAGGGAALIVATLLWVTASPGEAHVTPLSGGRGAAVVWSF